jgi:hypothetical protein
MTIVAALGFAVAAHATQVLDVGAAVEGLSSDALRGRAAGTEDGARAGGIVQAWLLPTGLSPLFGDSWRQPLDGVSGMDRAFNVGGVLRGTGDEIMVIGAHYDGLGVPESGEHAGEIHNGADDNASGVAALARIAETLGAAKPGARSLAFVAFTGEEQGLLGSEYFVAHPPFPLENVVAMLNLDTVGRLENDRLIVFGTGTAEEFPDLLRGVNYAFRFDLALQSEGAGASDHTPFFAKGIPVLHFFTGANADYHRPTDDAELVNVAGIERVADYVAEVAGYLAADETVLTFRPAGAEHLVAATGTTRRRVSFGSIPDFSKESGGILLSGVMPGGAAEEAGLAAGDLIVEIDGVEIDTIHDFQGVLTEHDPGDRVPVRYQRDGETKACEVVLRERK